MFLPHESVTFVLLCFHALLLVAALLFLTAKRLLQIRAESMGDTVPPGSRGFPLVGETLHFMAAIHSGRGFYHFVQSRRLRYACSLIFPELPFMEFSLLQ